MEEQVLTDKLIDYHSGLIKIYDNIFELKLNDGQIITGDLSEDISKKYKMVYSNDFFGTIGKSTIYNKEMNAVYTVHRLIEMII